MVCFWLRVALDAVVVLVLAGGTGRAAPTDLLAPFGNFALRGPEEPAPGAPPDDYAQSGPDPGWQIVQWNIPGGRLSPFVSARSAHGETLTATSAEAMVRITRGHDGTTIELSQDGMVLPCVDDRGVPRESDLFFGPKDRTTPGPNALRTGVVPLAQLRSLVMTATVHVRFGETARPKGCKVNQGSAIASIVLSDTVAHPPQTAFYKVSFIQPCGPNPALRVCEPGHNAPGWYFRTNPFGVDDWLPLFGQPSLRSGETRTITLELLSRLRHLIATGPKELDHDPAHWSVNTAYAGQHIWGDFRLTSTWSAFQVIATSN